MLPLAGLECNTTWDGWLCWDETEAGVTAEQGCPDYFNDFDSHGTSNLFCTNTHQSAVSLHTYWKNIGVG